MFPCLSRRAALAVLAALAFHSVPTGRAADASAENPAKPARTGKPIRALLVTGGCCHNYPFQSRQLMDAVDRVANVEWKVVNEGGTGTKAQIALYDHPNWAKGFDVVVHNECFADTTDPEYIRRIVAGHREGVPAVVIHCAMHTYRATDIDDWREFLGVTSRRHDPLGRYPITVLAPEHPALMGLPETWTMPIDELYVIDKVWPNTKVLASSVSAKDGRTYPVIWTSTYGKARVFGTTFGHSDDTFADPLFLQFASRGVLWAAGRLE